MTRSSHGYTLLETLLAVFVLTVAVLSSMGLQATSMASSSASRRAEAATTLARTEIERQRGLTTRAGGACGTVSSGGLSCSVTVTPCAINGTTIACGASVTSPNAQDVTVTVAWNGGSVSLRTLIMVMP